MSIKVSVKTVIDSEFAIARWSSLQTPASATVTMAIVVGQCKPVIEAFRAVAQAKKKEFDDFSQKHGVTQAEINAKIAEINAEIADAEKEEVELNLGTIPMSKLKKGKIKPSAMEIAAMSWLITMDIGDEDFEDYVEAKSLAKDNA